MTAAADHLTSTIIAIGYAIMIVTMVIGVAISLPYRTKARQVAKDMKCLLRANGIKCPIDANKKRGSLYAHNNFPFQEEPHGQGVRSQRPRF